MMHLQSEKVFNTDYEIKYLVKMEISHTVRRPHMDAHTHTYQVCTRHMVIMAFRHDQHTEPCW